MNSSSTANSRVESSSSISPRQARWAARIEAQVAHLDRRRPLARRAPHDRPQAREQLGERERLRQVVVGAGVEAADPVADRVAGGEHQHRHPHLALAQAAQGRETVDGRQHHVEQDGVVRRGLDHPQRVLAVGGDVCCVALLAQAAGDQGRHLRFVLDDEHPHSAIVATRRPVRRPLSSLPHRGSGLLDRRWLSSSTRAAARPARVPRRSRRERPADRSDGGGAARAARRRGSDDPADRLAADAAHLPRSRADPGGRPQDGDDGVAIRALLLARAVVSWRKDRRRRSCGSWSLRSSSPRLPCSSAPASCCSRCIPSAGCWWACTRRASSSGSPR